MGHIVKKYLWILGIVCSVLIGYLLAKTLVIFIEQTFFPQSGVVMASTQKSSEIAQEQKVKVLDVDAILKRNFFDAEETLLINDPPPTIDEPIDLSGDKPVLTTLPLKLFAAMSMGDGRNEYSSCTVELSGKSGTYSIKDKNPFGNNTKIVRVLPKRVEFSNSGRLEYVELEDFAKLVDLNKKSSTITSLTPSSKDPTDSGTKDIEVQRDGDVFQVSRAELEKALEDLASLQKEIRITLNYDSSGKPAGFKVLSLKRGSVFEKLGIRKYDILKTVNGQTLDVQSGFNTFLALKNESEFELEVERGGQPKIFKYQVI